MTSLIAAALLLLLLAAAPVFAQLDEFLRGLQKGPSPSVGAGLSEQRIADGLKQALQVGTEKAVKLTGRVDGYWKNEAIKILMPERLQTLERGLRLVGYGPQVDEFELSMNRAAERAAPAARTIFVDAIKSMTFDDARRVLQGGETAATEYFKGRTTGKLSEAFSPIVSKAMNEVGVTRQYKDLTRSLPFGEIPSFDLDHYVVGKALDGLFLTLGQEERKIRTNPTARVSELLKDVFGR